MSVSLAKGQRISLSKDSDGLKKVVVGLGWNPVKQGFFGIKPQIDCDASALYCKNGQYAGVVYYGDRSALNKAIYHHGDNLTGSGRGDDEQITVDLTALPSEVDKIVFFVNIYQASQRKQDFGLIDGAFIRLVNAENHTEICKYDLSEKYDGKTAMILGEIYKKGTEWKFNAIGTGTTDNSISEVIGRYR